MVEITPPPATSEIDRVPVPVPPSGHSLMDGLTGGGPEPVFRNGRGMMKPPSEVDPQHKMPPRPTREAEDASTIRDYADSMAKHLTAMLSSTGGGTLAALHQAAFAATPVMLADSHEVVSPIKAAPRKAGREGGIA